MATEQADEPPAGASSGSSMMGRRLAGARAWLGCCWRGDGVIHPITLKFRRDPGLEAGYAQANRKKLVKSASNCSAVAAICGLFILAARRPWKAGTSREFGEITGFANMMLLSFVIFFFVVSAIFRAPFLQRVSYFAVETLGGCSVCVPVMLLPLAIPWYAAHVLENDPSRFLPREYSTDTGLLLCLDACVTGVYVGIGIRFCYMPVFHLMALLSYGIPSMVLQISPEPENASRYVALVLSVIVMSAWGKYNFEYQERTHFSALIEEKTARVTTEFQLSKMRSETRQKMVPSDSQRSREQEQRADDRTSGTSVCSRNSDSTMKSTTESDLAFALNGTDDEIIRSITAVGAKEQWLVKTSELSPLEDSFVGSGAFGVVTKGLYHGSIVAIKSPGANGGDNVKKQKLPQLCTELQIMRRLRHPNIVFLFGATLSSTGSGLSLALIMEFVVGQPLGEFLAKKAPADHIRLGLLLHMASALRYLHSRAPAVIHGDLKESNVFVESVAEGDSRAKLLDFGLSRRLTKRAAPMGGSARWAAPELFRAKRHPSRAADVYSLGRLIFHVATGRLPFEDVQKDQLPRLLRRGGPPPWPDDFGDPPSMALSMEYRSLVAMCCEPQAGRRPDIFYVLQSLAKLGHKLRLSPQAALSSSCELLRRLGTLSSDSILPPQNTLAPGSLSTVMESEGQEGSSGEAAPEWRASDPSKTQSKSLQALLLHESFAETPVDTMKKSLALNIMQWNFKVPARDCCWLHAAARLASHLQGELLALHCDPEPVPVHGRCAGCGLMVLDGDDSWCSLCGTRFVGAGGSTGDGVASI